MKILVVEDEKYILDGILSVIRKNVNFPVKLAGVTDSCKALPKAREFCPDLMITDIVMPNQNGLELINGIRMEKICDNIIIISAHDDFQFAQKAIQMGVMDYLLKPIDKAQLLEDIRLVQASRINRKHEAQARALPDHPFLRDCAVNCCWPDSLKKILRFIKSNYSRDLSLLELSERFSLNTNYVSSLFTKHMGQSFLQYMNHIRIRKAAELLIYEESMSVAEISHAVGYFNERKMYRAFKRYLDLTPGDIRKSAARS